MICDDNAFRFELSVPNPIAFSLSGDGCDLTIGDADAAISLLLAEFMRGEPGAKGDKGDTGDRGPIGPSGGETYTHEQPIPAATWIIPHLLGRYPSVTVVDSAGTTVDGDPSYTDVDHVAVRFAYPFAGRAFLN